MIRYAILYFILLVVFILLLVGPVIVSKVMTFNFDIPMDLLQPTGLEKNDTTASVTGTCAVGNCPAGPGGDDADSTGSAKLRRYMAF